MYSISIGGIRFHISVLFPAVFLMLWYPSGDMSLLMGLMAMSAHELGHLTALLVCREKPTDITLSAFGMRFDVSSTLRLSVWQDLLVAAAGPLTNFICAVLLCPFDSTWSALHVALGTVNLLPLYPLDGERILRSILQHGFSLRVADQVIHIVSWLFWGLLAMLSIGLLCYENHNPTLMLFTLYIGIIGLLPKGN